VGKRGKERSLGKLLTGHYAIGGGREENVMYGHHIHKAEKRRATRSLGEEEETKSPSTTKEIK